ncbi:MAG: F0F1 ATP synthase subunit epsilon [Firmicutes bacterium]|nr:F0F1 ATP synthase subunit epsilon [Bacillota bacterium]
MSAFRLEIVTPAGTVFSSDVESVTAQTLDGQIGVLAGHIPLVTVLETGVMRVRTAEKEEVRLAVSGGFMEMSSDNKLTVLAQTAERAEEIDVERALSAKQRAEERLAAADDSVDIKRAEAALRRAKARLQATGAEDP